MVQLFEITQNREGRPGYGEIGHQFNEEWNLSPAL